MALKLKNFKHLKLRLKEKVTLKPVIRFASLKNATRATAPGTPPPPPLPSPRYFSLFPCSFANKLISEYEAQFVKLINSK